MHTLAKAKTYETVENRKLEKKHVDAYGLATVVEQLEIWALRKTSRSSAQSRNSRVLVNPGKGESYNQEICGKRQPQLFDKPYNQKKTSENL